ncbi:uncharacterized protein A1O9_01238 [Exophiala aquamarina CBS 119918]|uniref:histidine kinase n=1 Tax=Exophiala aquamarina CBS 119918 TaxID=1182545 RepID=A0A072PTW1_9EURO|nr:uncharacterized protein A1O9_01238 [Exophiala aquamarina CBS 119918]KEF63261.1 hypothetical protein A1O9_01238 [Exophiala aquamarina CBS 119918]
MSQTPPHSKALELFRERVVSRYTVATKDLPRPESGVDVTVPDPSASQVFVPKSSGDPALTAFAQLGALRLDASRALISLIDTTHQYVLAEATKSLSSQSDERHDLNDGLWIGSVVLPRESGICEVVLTSDKIHSTRNSEEGLADITDKDEIVIIQDLRQDSRYCMRRYVKDGPQLRFYAGAPIRNVGGTIVGAFAVLDDKPRQGLPASEKMFMVDMSKTIMKHIESIRIQAEFQRRDKLVVGLESFVQGLSEIPRSQPTNPNQNAQGTVVQGVPITEEALRQISHGSDISSMRSLSMWEIALPSGCKSLFSRASNIIRESAGYDGVAFFYVSSSSSTGSSSRRQFQASETGGEKSRYSSTSSTSSELSQSALPASTPDPHQSESSFEDLSGNEETNLDGLSPILGFALSKTDEQTRPSDQTRFPRFRLRDLQKLMGTRPRGRVYFLDRSGYTMPGDSSSSGSGADIPAGNPGESLPPLTTGQPGSGHSKKRSAQVNSLLKIHPQARTFICLPLWDHNRQRWFAFCICWIVTPTRDPTVDGDLNFMRIFCNNITNALYHLDTLDSEEAKSSFVASISHELRSPLHGVLGATNFLYDSELNRYQLEMVDSITNSGRTLLDTLEHVMDFTKINNFTKSKSTSSDNTKLEDKKSSATSRKNDIRRSSLTTSVDLCELVEEVVEAVFMGFTFQHDFLYSDDTSETDRPNLVTRPSDLANSRRSLHQRGRVRLALEIPPIDNTVAAIQPGAWRRIVMNIVGNALKYTNQGLITISLTLSAFEDDPQQSGEQGQDVITLTVKDSGIGMSNEFLQNRLFKPFSQEDSFSSGTGLGLSIVDQIVKSLGGYVDVSSARGLGTTITVCANACRGTSRSRRSDHASPQAIAKSLSKLHVTVLEDTSSKASTANPEGQRGAEAEFCRILLSNLNRWFGVETAIQSTWIHGSADLIICLEPSFRLIESIRSQARDQGSPAPPILVISHDALEMAVLRRDVRIQSEESVIEITHQPLGPRKLSKAIYQCLERSRLLSPTRSQDSVPTDESAARTIPTLQSFPFPAVSSGTSRTAAPASIASTTEAAQQVTMPAVKSDSVLCVDDNSLNRKLLTNFIKSKGLTPVAASNGKEAVDRFKAANGAFKCVLMG